MYRLSSSSDGSHRRIWGKEIVRSASVDNRSRSIWLLAGLGVLIWAALSVFLSGSSAHADETPAHPSHQQVAPEKQPQKQARQHRAPKAAPESHWKASAAPRTVATESAPAAAPRKADFQRSGEAARQVADAVMKSTAVQTTVLNTRPEIPSLPPQAKRVAAQIPDRIQDDRGRQSHTDHPGRSEDHPHNRGAHAQGWRAVHHAVQAAAPAMHVAHAKHDAHGKHDAHAKHDVHAHHRVNVKHSSPAASAPARTAPASAPVSAAVVASDEAPAHSHSPFDSRDTSTHHQPAAPPSVASSAAGTSASPGVIPGTAGASDVLGPQLSAAHADDDILPSGPAGTTDNSPD
jgi:hypothetical protein